MELKKRQEEKLMLIEQRKAEKTAEREKKIVKNPNSTIFFLISFAFFFQQEKCTEMVLAREMKRIAEDLILRDLKVKLRDEKKKLNERFHFVFSLAVANVDAR